MRTLYVNTAEWDGPVSDTTHEIYNAPWPLYGAQAWEGELRYGRHYSALPHGSVETVHELNANKGAAVIRLVDDETAWEMLGEVLVDHGHTLVDLHHDPEEVMGAATWFRIPLRREYVTSRLHEIEKST